MQYCGIESVLQNVMKTFLTFLINKCQYKTSYLIFAAEIKINMKNTTAFFNAMQTSCMMDVLKVILFCKWGRLGNERSELTNHHK
jgi:hypothetical protein